LIANEIFRISAGFSTELPPFSASYWCTDSGVEKCVVNAGVCVCVAAASDLAVANYDSTVIRWGIFAACVCLHQVAIVTQLDRQLSRRGHQCMRPDPKTTFS
jgi:hypothetical protein